MFLVNLSFRFVVSIFFLIATFCPLSFLYAQGTKMVEYNPDFKFKEGVYITFEQWKNNSPVTKQRIITKIDPNDLDYFAKVLTEEEIQYFDEYGIQQIKKVYDIWGYCRKGMVFINWKGEFHRMPVIGNVCYFAALVTVATNRYQDPFDPYYPTLTMGDNTSEEVRQYLIDFETGNVIDFNIHNVEEILKKDVELYNEFKALKKKKKRILAFSFIRKYNSSFPVSFPVN